VRLVPVSTFTPARSPGTALSTALGSGGGGGRIASGFVGRDFAFSAVTTVIGPVIAPIGTRTESVVSERERTLTFTSSALP
jgi:hypothetical protein